MSSQSQLFARFPDGTYEPLQFKTNLEDSDGDNLYAILPNNEHGECFFDVFVENYFVRGRDVPFDSTMLFLPVFAKINKEMIAVRHFDDLDYVYIEVIEALSDVYMCVEQ